MLNKIKKIIKSRRTEFTLIFLTSIIYLLARFVTGYSFSIDLLDNLVIGIIIILPIIYYLFYYLNLYNLLIIVVVVIILSPFGYCYLFAYSLSSEKKLDTYAIKNYRITEIEEEYWTTTYYRYDLEKTVLFGFFGKKIAKSDRESQKSNICIMDFKSLKNDKRIYQADKCKNTLEIKDS